MTVSITNTFDHNVLQYCSLFKATYVSEVDLIWLDCKRSFDK